MNNHRILFIMHLPPPMHGAAMVGQHIQKSKKINSSFDCHYINLSTSKNIEEIGKNPAQKVILYLSIIWHAIMKITRKKPELCYMTITARGSGFYKDAVIALLVKFFRVKLIFHLHNKGVITHQNKPFDNLLYKWVFKETEVILLSKHLYSDIQKYLPKEQVHFCSNGIPNTTAKRKSQMLKSEKIAEILFLSNLFKSKGVFILLDACKILKNEQIPFHCTFVGGEGDITINQFLQKIQELALESQVNYAGTKYGNEKGIIFEKSDIFVHPTYDDCFPLVLLEAMQHRLPVVSTFEGGIRDIVENHETGYLVPQKNAEALAEKLEMLIKNPELRYKMGNAGRIKYEKEFTLSVFENRLKNILNKSIAE